MANRITTVFDLDAKGFDTGLKSLRKEVAAADGAVAKLKTAGAGLGSILQDNIAQAAMAAGAALVTFGVKSVQAFQDAAIGASRFSEAAGIAVEDASRWMEVSGDLGLSADAVQGAIGRMNKALGANGDALKQYGVEVVRAADGTVDANATFIEAVTTIGQIADPTERALAAQKAFGKGYAEIAELMGMSAVELKARLDGVSDAKVIDPAEVAKAKEFRDRMDELQDRLQDVALTVGEAVVPILGDLARASGVAADAFGVLNTTLVEDEGASISLTSGYGDLIDFFKVKWNKVFGEEAPAALDVTTATIEAGTDAAKKMADMYHQRVVPSTDDVTEATKDAASATRDFQTEIDELYGIQRSAMERQLEFEQSTRDLADAIADSKSSLKDQADAAITASEKFAELEGASLDSRDGTLRQIESLQAFADTLAPGSDLRAFLDDYIARLRDIPAYIDTQITIGGVQAPPGIGVPDRPGGSGPGTVPSKPVPPDPKKMRGNSVTVSQPAAAAPVLLGGGITRTVSTRSGGGGGGTGEDRLMAAMAETGDISQDEYKAYLQGRLGEFEKYSDDYMRVWRQINSIDRQQQREADDAAREAQRLADEQARQLAADEAAKQKAADDEIRRTDQIMAAMFEMGAISLEQYRDYLNGRIGAYEQYSQQYMAIWRQLQMLEGGGRGGGNASSADEVRLAELEAQRLQFISDMYGLDAKRTEEEKLKARIDAANAQQRLADLRSRMAPSSTTANSTNVTINMPPGSNGADVVRSIQDYERRNGKGWRTA